MTTPPVYINGIPSSLIGYGSNALSFSSYDGVLNSNEGSLTDIDVQTLDSQLSQVLSRIEVLEAKFTSISIGNQLNVASVNTQNLTVTGNTSLKSTTINGNATCKSTLTVTGNHYANGYTNYNANVSLNDRTLYLRGITDNNHRIQWNGDRDGPEIVGNLGGKLSYRDSSTNTFKGCMEWGGQRIRSLKTFQAGKQSNSHSGQITFQDGGFLNVPIVTATPVENTNVDGTLTSHVTSGVGTDYIHLVQVYDVTTTAFRYRVNQIALKSTGPIFRIGEKVSDGDATTALIPFNWVAFDPTASTI